MNITNKFGTVLALLVTTAAAFAGVSPQGNAADCNGKAIVATLGGTIYSYQPAIGGQIDMNSTGWQQTRIGNGASAKISTNGVIGINPWPSNLQAIRFYTPTGVKINTLTGGTGERLELLCWTDDGSFITVRKSTALSTRVVVMSYPALLEVRTIVMTSPNEGSVTGAYIPNNLPETWLVSGSLNTQISGVWNDSTLLNGVSGVVTIIGRESTGTRRILYTVSSDDKGRQTFVENVYGERKAVKLSNGEHVVRAVWVNRGLVACESASGTIEIISV